nr:hypothetical protein Iba_chr13eCG3290 [Ipomoea batatas]
MKRAAVKSTLELADLIRGIVHARKWKEEWASREVVKQVKKIYGAKCCTDLSKDD